MRFLSYFLTIQFTLVTLVTSAQLTDESICDGESVLLDAVSGAVSYNWSTGETASSISVDTEGEYIVEIFDGEVTYKDTAYVTVLPKPDQVKGDTMVCQGELLTISPGTYSSYLWGDAANNSTNSSVEVAAIVDWVLDVTVTNSFGCSLSDTVFVYTSVPMELELDTGKTLCYGESDAWASVAVVSGGIAPFTYLWGNGATTDTIYNVPAQAYSIEVVDAAGCQALDDVIVEEGPEAALSVLTWSYDAICMGANGSAVALGLDGTPPYSYDWETGGQTGDSAINLLPGLHKVTVIDDNGCTETVSELVANQNETIDMSGTISNSTCGMSNGQATANPSGGYPPYTYAWNGGESSKSIAGIAAGFYSVTVTDSLGCVDSYTLPISDDEGPSVSVDSADQSVCSQLDGAIYISTTGGTAPLTYGWNNGSTKEDLTKVGPGQYFIEVTDANGCKGNLYQTIGTNGFTAPKIGGMLTSSLNDSTMKAGKVTIIQNLNQPGVLPKFTSVNVDSNGVFEFESVLVGEYFLFASPDTSKYPASFKTFYPGVSRWNDASGLQAACEDSVAADFEVTQKFILNGKAKITGKITQQTKGEVNKTQGDPIPGIDVSLEQTPGGIVAQTATDEDGIYLFDNVPPGEYEIFVDIPGLPMDSTYSISVPETQEDTSILALDFLVDSTESVYIEPVASGIFEVVQGGVSVSLFPNPSSGKVTIAYYLKERERISIELLDVTGRQLQTVISSRDQYPGSYRYTLDARAYGAGIHFIRMQSGATQQVYPLMIVE